MLLLGAVGLHSASLLWVHFRAGSINAYAFRSLDCSEYYSIAKNIVEHGAFSQDSAPPFTPDTWRTPGYPLFLTLSMLLFGKSPTALVLIQHVLAIASIPLFFTIISRHASPRRAFFTSLILLLEPYHLFYAFWLLSTTLFTFMLLGTWWFWEKARHSANIWHYATLGLLCGFLVLIWPGAILVPIFLVAGACLSLFAKTSPHHPIATSPHRIMVLVLLAVSAATPSAIWMTRNLLVAGHFALSHQSGIVLAYFKATEVELWRQSRTEDRYVETSLNPGTRDVPHIIWDDIDQALCVRMTGVRPPVPFYPLYVENKPFVLSTPNCKKLK